MTTPLADLIALLLEVFGHTSELRAFVSGLEDGRALAAAIPERDALAEVAPKLAGVLERRGRIEPELFAALLGHIGPGRRARIEEVAARFGAVDGDGARARYRARVRFRAEELPALFRLVGDAHALPDVYVDVEVDEEGHGGRAAKAGPRSQVTLHDVLTGEGRWWALRGAPGAGKSTLLKMTALRLLGSGAGLPVLATAPELCAAPRDLGFVPEADRAVVAAAVRAREAVFFVDGLDEAADRRVAVRAVQALAAEAVGCRVVVAGREEGFHEATLGTGFGRLVLRPLEGEAPRQLLEKRLGDAALAQAAEAKLVAEGLGAFLENPLLLTLIALMVKNRGLSRLPSHRVGLLAEAVDVLCKDHAEDRGRGFADREAGMCALSEVALALHGTPGDQLDREVVEVELVEAGLGTEAAARAFVEEVARVTGLVVIRGYRADQSLRFSHRMFREHLAAAALEREIRASGEGQGETDLEPRGAARQQEGVGRGAELGRVEGGGGALEMPLGGRAEAVLERAAAPAVWAETLAQAVAMLGGHGRRGAPPAVPERVAALVRAAKARSPELAFRLVAAADTLPAGARGRGARDGPLPRRVGSARRGHRAWARPARAHRCPERASRARSARRRACAEDRCPLGRRRSRGCRPRRSRPRAPHRAPPASVRPASGRPPSLGPSPASRSPPGRQRSRGRRPPRCRRSARASRARRQAAPPPRPTPPRPPPPRDCAPAPQPPRALRTARGRRGLCAARGP